ncbi:hypothetical protein D9M68_720290 [compost metagenome]
MVMSLISPTISSILAIWLSRDCTLWAERSTTSRIDWVPRRTDSNRFWARDTTSSIARFISSAVIEAWLISPSCSSTSISIACTASATWLLVWPA